ncbi:hypothetical protein D3C72_1717910 [compost metagenome]
MGRVRRTAASQCPNHLDSGGRLRWQGTLALDIDVEQGSSRVDSRGATLTEGIDQIAVLIDLELPGAGI